MLAVVYGVLIVVGNIQASTVTKYKHPDPEDAGYSIRIHNTGNTLYSNDVTQDGSVIILDGYWELVGEKYRAKDGIVELDQAIFGEIRVRRR